MRKYISDIAGGIFGGRDKILAVETVIVFYQRLTCSAEVTHFQYIISHWAFPGGSDGEECACNAGDPGSIPGWGRSPEEGNGSPFQYYCLENSMDRGVWQATVHGVAKNWTQLSD